MANAFLQPDVTARAKLENALSGALRLDVASAFVSRSGVEVLLELPRPSRIRLICRAGHGITDPYAVVAASEALGAEVRLVVGQSAARFHPKLYLVQSRDGLTVLTGSGNLTGGGLSTNVEQFEVMDFDPASPSAVTHQQRFNSIWAMGTPLDDLQRSAFWPAWVDQWKTLAELRSTTRQLDATLDDLAAQTSIRRSVARSKARWGKDVVYPLVAELIEARTHADSAFVNRDQLAEALLDAATGQAEVQRARDAGDRRTATAIAANMIDWFSADFENYEYALRFQRRRISAPGRSGRSRQIWAYRVNRSTG